MHTRTLGQGLEVSAIGLGCMTTTGGYSQHPDRDDMIAMIRGAVELGVTFFDTAEIYGPHANEELVGEALAPIRDQVVIATKFAQDIDPAERKPRGRMLLPARGRRRGRRLAASGSVSTSSTSTTSTGSTRKRRSRSSPAPLGDLIRAGKIRHWGMSEAAEATIRRAHAVTPVTAVQSEYSLWWRRPEEGVLAACAELGIGFVPFSPLGKGFLTGTVDTTHNLRAGRRPARPDPPVRSGRPGQEPRPRRRGQVDRRGQGRHTGPGRAGLAARPAAMDRAHPRHHQAAPPRRERRGSRRRAHRGRCGRAHRRVRCDRDRRRALPRLPGGPDQPVNPSRPDVRTTPTEGRRTKR